MTRIKICGITSLEDALDAVHSGADALGLVFYDKSPRHVGLQLAAQIADAIPPFVTLVGLFVNATEEDVRATMHAVPLDALQFHGDETPAFCAQFGRPYLKAIRVKAGIDLLQYATDFAGAQGLLLDTYVDGMPGGTGSSFDWALIPYDLPLPVVLSGGLNAGNVAEAIRKVRPYAVDVSSGVEASKGIKDAEKIAAFVNAVIKVDMQLSLRPGEILRGHRTTVRK
ncbi:MAG: phosphoribosylanthranilate isomerase [Gallionellaceae bacterium]|jgi:phosphoribosylanthranilate isomerase